jgi:putative spermidine/putrescine transport system permease protein
MSVPRLAFRTLVVLLYFFLLSPLLITVVISFSTDPFLGFPPSGWGFRWYLEVARNAQFGAAARASLLVAVSVTVLALLAGVPAAYAIVRGRFPGRDALLALLTAPLLLPAIVLGLAILLVFVRAGLVATLHGMILAHLCVTLPYVVRITATALSTLTPEAEEAALTLGATPWKTFRHVTLPLMLPGMLGAAALSFLVSFDEVVLSLFLTGPRFTTLPVEIYHYVEYRTDPQVAALSVVLILLTVGLVLLIERSVGVMRALGR